MPATWAWVKGWAFWCLHVEGALGWSSGWRLWSEWGVGRKGTDWRDLLETDGLQRWRMVHGGRWFCAYCQLCWATTSSSSSFSLLLQPSDTPKPRRNETSITITTTHCTTTPYSTTHMPKSRQHNVWLRDEAARQRCSTDMAQWSKIGGLTHKSTSGK